jgi:hypothetical protein
MHYSAKYFFTIFCAIIFLINFSITALASQPHIPHQGVNLLTNPNINGSSGWIPSTVYDSTVSRDSGTGSLKLTIPYPQTGYNYINTTDLIPVIAGQVYSFSAYMRSSTFPCPVPVFYVAYYDANKNYIRNSFGSRQGVTTAGVWQECSYVFRPVDNTAYIKLKITLMEQPKNYPTGTVWLDNFYLGSGIGL